jgi:hypothetical protein
MHTEVGLNEWAQKPTPNGSLVVGRVAVELVAAVGSPVVRVGWTEAAEPCRGEQEALARVHRAPLPIER